MILCFRKKNKLVQNEQEEYEITIVHLFQYQDPLDVLAPCSWIIIT